MAEKARVIILEDNDGHDISIVPAARQHLEQSGLAEIFPTKSLEEALSLLAQVKDTEKVWLIYHQGYPIHVRTIKSKFPDVKFACYCGGALHYKEHPISLNADIARGCFESGYDFVFNDRGYSFLEMLMQ